MNRNLLDILVCPYSKNPLKIEVFEGHGDEIEFGLLHSEAGEYPIVAGIPILFLGRTDLVNLLRRGCFEEAVALATIGPPPPAGIWRISRWLQDTYRFQRLGEWIEQPRKNSWLRQVMNVLFPPDGTKPGPRRLFELAYRKCRIRPTEVFNYNYYRYSMPSHLVALSFVHAMGRPQGLVLDLACGAGHITWSIQRQVAPQQVIGLDGFFFSLYVARTCIAPDVWFVCGDVNALPFRDSSFSVVFCSDAFFNFQYKWSSLREIERVLNSTGMLILVWLKNKLHKHPYPGRPLTPQGYRRLVEHLPHRLIPDSLTLQRYLEGYGLMAEKQVDDETLNQSPTLSIWAMKGKATFADMGPFEHWPHAYGVLGINPLYELKSSSPDGSEYVRRFPSKFYEEENPEMKCYLPERFYLSKEQETALRQNRSNGLLEELIRNCAVLGFPPGYLD